MKKYGSKDLDRMLSIKEKSNGDYMRELMYAYNMSCAITEPGKAMARGYAAQEVFGEHAAIAQIFFERSHDLGGEDVKPTASVNPFDDPDSELSDIPLEEQPGSRRKNPRILKGEVKRKHAVSNIISLGKVNTIKGTGPKFSLYDYPQGTIEVWETKDNKYRLVYTSHYEPVYLINEKRSFRYDGKVVEWTMVDYIESINIANLAPLYGKSIPIYCYD